jgi:hypothetical protein
MSVRGLLFLSAVCAACTKSAAKCLGNTGAAGSQGTYRDPLKGGTRGLGAWRSRAEGTVSPLMELLMMNSSEKGLVLPYKAESTPSSTRALRAQTFDRDLRVPHAPPPNRLGKNLHSASILTLGLSNSAGTRYRGPWDWSKVCYWTVRKRGQSPNACGVKQCCWARSTPDRQNAGSTEPVRVLAIRAAPADPTHLLAMQPSSPGIRTTSMARPNASVPVTQRRHGR